MTETSEMSEDTLGRSIRRGSLWLAGNSLMLRFANILVMVIVARIVSPEEFGIFSLAVVAHTFIVSVAELGVASAIARRDLDLDRIAPTSTTVSLGVSIILGAVLAVFSEPIAIALGSASAAPVLQILAISVVLSGVFVVPSAQLQRDFRQGVTFAANVSGMVIGSGALIALALVGDGAAAFAWSRVIGQVVTGVIVVIALRKRFLPGWSGQVWRFLIGFGVPLAAANLLSQVVVNVDYIFVGHALTLRDVGMYTLAFNVSSWATSVLGSVINGIALPALSAVRERGGDVREAAFSASRIVALVAFPIAAMCSGLASALTLTLYGEAWADAAPVIVILAVFGAVSAVGMLLANVLISAGRTIVLLIVQGAVLIALVPALWFGIQSAGLIGAGFAHVATALLITLPVYLVAVRRSTGIRARTVGRGIAWPLAAAVIAGGVAHVVSLMDAAPWIQLLAGGAAGGLVYIVLTGPQLVAFLPERARSRLPRILRGGSHRRTS